MTDKIKQRNNQSLQEQGFVLKGKKVVEGETKQNIINDLQEKGNTARIIEKKLFNSSFASGKKEVTIHGIGDRKMIIEKINDIIKITEEGKRNRKDIRYGYPVYEIAYINIPYEKKNGGEIIIQDSWIELGLEEPGEYKDEMINELKQKKGRFYAGNPYGIYEENMSIGYGSLFVSEDLIGSAFFFEKKDALSYAKKKQYFSQEYDAPLKQEKSCYGNLTTRELNLLNDIKNFKDWNFYDSEDYSNDETIGIIGLNGSIEELEYIVKEKLDIPNNIRTLEGDQLEIQLRSFFEKLMIKIFANLVLGRITNSSNKLVLNNEDKVLLNNTIKSFLPLLNGQSAEPLIEKIIEKLRFLIK
ncbi:hypothetical protein P148_SR1C00001G0974 [candidate division SR1 bacterium RAAC1_SR1_1]|nr:hypothetical protein P148_SR1C00001G0974 [candidate division SR1 bacterium RAAC1_SR1_1]